jgi:hypothetical protein
LLFYVGGVDAIGCERGGIETLYAAVFVVFVVNVLSLSLLHLLLKRFIEVFLILVVLLSMADVAIEILILNL